MIIHYIFISACFDIDGDILVIDIDDLSGLFSGEIQPMEPEKKPTVSCIAAI